MPLLTSESCPRPLGAGITRRRVQSKIGNLSLWDRNSAIDSPCHLYKAQILEVLWPKIAIISPLACPAGGLAPAADLSPGPVGVPRGGAADLPTSPLGRQGPQRKTMRHRRLTVPMYIGIRCAIAVPTTTSRRTSRPSPTTAFAGLAVCHAARHGDSSRRLVRRSFSGGGRLGGGRSPCGRTPDAPGGRADSCHRRRASRVANRSLLACRHPLPRQSGTDASSFQHVRPVPAFSQSR